MLAMITQHARIAQQFARVGVIRKAQFQVEFFFQVLMDCLWYVSHISIFEVLYVHTTDIAGWNREAFRVLLGFMFVSDAFVMIWLTQMWRFGRDLKDGRLDSFRVRPAATFFVYGFQLFSLEGCANMTVALGYLIYGVSVATPAWTLSLVLVTLVAILLSFWARVVIMALFSIFELWFLGSEAGRFVSDIFHAANDRPAEIFGPRMRLFLLYVVPVGALSQVPAALVLGRYSPLEGIAACFWLFVLGTLVFALWNRSFRRYESAMS